ncbi:Transposase IS200 like protein [Phycisphaerae bacterium RAS1]|nr:Transposase IS200 like protein [Phycisphaerae bacterium RAS1]
MPDYRRWREVGATYFFTLVTADRRPILNTDATVDLLRASMARVRAAHPFEIIAAVMLPDHLHMIWTLPPEDGDFSDRWRLIKSEFTRRFLRAGGAEALRSDSRLRNGERGVWQRRYWEHRIRDDADYQRHVEYIHFNPVKHGLALCPHAWRWSSFSHWVAARLYDEDWACACPRNGAPRPPFRVADVQAGE